MGGELSLTGVLMPAVSIGALFVPGLLPVVGILGAIFAVIGIVNTARSFMSEGLSVNTIMTGVGAGLSLMTIGPGVGAMKNILSTSRLSSLGVGTGARLPAIDISTVTGSARTKLMTDLSTTIKEDIKVVAGKIDKCTLAIGTHNEGIAGVLSKYESVSKVKPASVKALESFTDPAVRATQAGKLVNPAGGGACKITETYRHLGTEISKLETKISGYQATLKTSPNCATTQKSLSDAQAKLRELQKDQSSLRSLTLKRIRHEKAHEHLTGLHGNLTQLETRVNYFLGNPQAFASMDQATFDNLNNTALKTSWSEWGKSVSLRTYGEGGLDFNNFMTGARTPWTPSLAVA